MRVKYGIAVLAIGVSLAGCGTAPSGVASGAPQVGSGDMVNLRVQNRAPGSATTPRGDVSAAPRTDIPATPQGSDVSISPPAGTPGPAVDTTAEAGKPLADIQRTMIKRFFTYLENKSPQAKVRLHSLEQRLLALDMQQLMALKAIRFQKRMDKTVDDIRKEIETYVLNPDALVADLGGDLDKVMAMSAQDLSATRAQLPPIFAEVMKAITEPVAMAGHEDETAQVPTP